MKFEISTFIRFKDKKATQHLQMEWSGSESSYWLASVIVSQ